MPKGGKRKQPKPHNLPPELRKVANYKGGKFTKDRRQQADFEHRKAELVDKYGGNNEPAVPGHGGRPPYYNGGSEYQGGYQDQMMHRETKEYYDYYGYGQSRYIPPTGVKSFHRGPASYPQGAQHQMSPEQAQAQAMSWQGQWNGHYPPQPPFFHQNQIPPNLDQYGASASAEDSAVAGPSSRGDESGYAQQQPSPVGRYVPPHLRNRPPYHGPTEPSSQHSYYHGGAGPSEPRGWETAESQSSHWNSNAQPYYGHGHYNPAFYPGGYLDQRGFHTSAPYNYAHPDAPFDQDSASMHRAKLPPATRNDPRRQYVEQASSHTLLGLSENDLESRKLLVVLDLNGTLVFRVKGKQGRAVDSTRPIPRPYLSCFLQYCLGDETSSDVATEGEEATEYPSAEGRPVSSSSRPHGSQFWYTSSDGRQAFEPSSKGRAEVIIWSSAQPKNVDSMVIASFDADIRAKILRVWARDTLVVSRLFNSKAESVKDLEIVWAELNFWINGKRSANRLKADARDRADQIRPDLVEDQAEDHQGYQQETQALEGQAAAASSAAEDAFLEAQDVGPWGQHNTVLVDDSPLKAKLQPYNHLLIPEFDKKSAKMMRRYMRQQLAQAQGGTPSEAEVEEELDYDSDLSIAEDGRKHQDDAAQSGSATVDDDATMTKNVGETEAEEEQVEEADETGNLAERKRKEKKPVPASRLDDVLLQTIGVLETLRYQSDVSSFIFGGGIEGYGEPQTARNETEHRHAILQQKTPEYWAHLGKLTCQKLGIEVKPWTPRPSPALEPPAATRPYGWYGWRRQSASAPPQDDAVDHNKNHDADQDAARESDSDMVTAQHMQAVPEEPETAEETNNTQGKEVGEGKQSDLGQDEEGGESSKQEAERNMDAKQEGKISSP